MVAGLRTAEKIAESGEGSVGVRFWFIGGIQRGQQPFGRHAIEVAERSWARTSGLGGEHDKNELCAFVGMFGAQYVFEYPQIQLREGFCPPSASIKPNRPPITSVGNVTYL